MLSKSHILIANHISNHLTCYPYQEKQVEAKHLSLLCEEVLSECEEEEEGPVKRSVKINEEENEEVRLDSSQNYLFR